MRLSTIITAYNYARFLPAAIESVLAQTLLPDEIVVVDDGSTDNTREIVARYASQGVRYLYKENGGAGSARNHGILNTSGDLIAFLDGDDRWLPNKIALQVAHIEQNPGVGLVTGSEWQVYEAGTQPYLLRRSPLPSRSIYPHILVENTIGNPSLTLVRRECFNTVGLFEETMPLGQDWDMWIRIAHRYPIGCLAEPLILFTRHSTSLTSGKLMERYNSNLRIQSRYISRISNPITRAQLLMSARSMNYYYTAAALADDPTSNHKGRAFRMALASALLNPAHETRNKAGLLLRIALPGRIFKQIRQIRRRVPVVGEHTPS